MAPPKSDFEKQMIVLEAEIRRLEAEFNMFFAGRLPRPPWETRARVAALVKKHDQSFIRNTADRFRFESLQNRHQKFLELWERQMNNREIGRPMPGGKRTQPAPEPAAPSAPAGQEPAAGSPATVPAAVAAAAASRRDSGVVRFNRSQELSQDSGAVKDLYEQLAAAKKQAGESPVAIDRLAALVKAQVQKFASEGKDVSFKIATKDGKVTLTAKAADEK